MSWEAMLIIMRDILNHELALDVIKETGFPEELVVNTDREKLYPFINRVSESIEKRLDFMILLC